MTKNKLAATLLAFALAVLAAGCSSDTTTTNNANANANVANANHNANANANTANTNANANTNMSGPTRAEYEKDKARYDKEAREKAKSGGSAIGTGVEDAWLWTKVRAALLAADDLRDSTINVDVNNAEVTLKGSVASAAQKTKAETVAKGVEGVKGVKNQLTVSADKGAANANANKAASTNANANAKH
ncbi:MAG: BON domain-containing protein [Pyrinomonadaceae bacterium]